MCRLLHAICYLFQSLHMTIRLTFNFIHQNVLSNRKQLWHRRLGHTNEQAIQTIFKLCNMPVSRNSGVEICNSCCLGKYHRLYAAPSLTQHTAPFELIHTDLWGPSPEPSSQDFSHYIAFVDAHTRFTWIYFLKAKFDAFKAFTVFSQLIHTQFSHKRRLCNLTLGESFALSLSS